MRIEYQRLREFVTQIFEAMGCSADNANLAAKVLTSADIRGIDSHGVARLPGYVRLWEAGRIRMDAQPHVVHETPSTAVFDGEAGLGLIVAPMAMQLAMEKAAAVGTGWVAVRNSNHFGIAGYHAMMALKQNMIGMAMTNASALVAPTFGKERMLGTNPIAVAIPAGEQPPLVADFATTTAANGKLELLQQDNLDAPYGWAIDAEGMPSTDSSILKKGGALLQLGSDKEHGSHKGYALGSIVDIFSAVLSGASYGPWAPPFPAYIAMPAHMPGQGLGHFFGAMRIDAFRPESEFLAHMDNWICRFRSTQPAPGHEKVLIPGDPERNCEADRLINGVPLHNSVYQSLLDLSNRFGPIL